MRKQISRALTALALTIVATLTMVGSGQAVIVGRTGTLTDRQTYTTENTAWATGVNTAWVQVPGAIKTVTLTSVHLLEADFGAESRCTGVIGGYCSVRIVLERPTGALQEFDPVAGTDFSWDAISTDSYEAHSIKRVSPFLPAATYRVRVQARIVGTGVLRLDEWTLKVATVRP